MPNIVFIGTSIDGYIADKEGQLGFLEAVPNPDGLDFGFGKMMASVDALLMGRNTYEFVLGFDGEWPYAKPVYVLSSNLSQVPERLQEKVFIVKGELEEVVTDLNAKGMLRLYIDGGQVIQSFLAKDMIDEMIITRVPMLLGGGVPLFGTLAEHLEFEHVKTEVMLNAHVKSHYRRKR